MKIERESIAYYPQTFFPVCGKLKSFFVNKIEGFSEWSNTAWENFKFRFRTKSDTDFYLENLDNESSIDWEKNGAKIGQLMATTSPYTPSGIRLKRLISKCPSEKLSKVFEAALDHLFSLEKGSFESIVKLLEKNTLEQAFANKKSTSEIFKELHNCLPSPRNASPPSFCPLLSKVLRVVSRFFPRFMDTLLKAFNLMEVGRSPETPWDFYATLSIYFKLFMVPYAFFFFVAAFVSIPSQALLLTALMLLLAVTGVCAYIRYRPIPQELPRAKNLSEEAAQSPSYWIGREESISELLGAIENKKETRCIHVLVKGKSGAGKTELIKEVARRCKEKTFFLINTPQFVDGFTALEDKIGLLLLDLKGHEHKIVLVFEEFGDVIQKKQKNIGGCLKSLMDKQQVQVIALSTDKEYSSIQEDEALDNRFQKIELQAPTKEQTLRILRERLNTDINDVLFEEEIFDAINKKTENLAQPRSAVDLLQKAILTVQFNIKNFTSLELIKKRQALKELQSEYKEALLSQKNVSSIVNDIEQAKIEIEKLEFEDFQSKQKIASFEKLLQWRKKAKQLVYSTAQKRISEKLALFNYHILLPWIQKKIKQLPEKMVHMKYKIDADLIKTL